MTKTIAVTPFIERCGEEPIVESYVVGVRAAREVNVGVKITLPARLVERTVMAGARLSLSLAPDGRFILHADGLDDETLDAATKAGGLCKQTVGALLSTCLDIEVLQMEDDPLADLVKLRAQLVRGLGQLDDAAEQLKRKPRRRA